MNKGFEVRVRVFNKLQDYDLAQYSKEYTKESVDRMIHLLTLTLYKDLEEHENRATFK